MTRRIKAIWAQDQKGLIGQDGHLPWRIPEELAHFKATTMGQAMLMGRVTFEGMGKRVLPGRKSLILTRDPNYQVDHPDVLVLQSVEEVLNWYQHQELELYVIGGREIFCAFEEYLDELICSEIQGVFEGDVYFPAEFPWKSFELFEQIEQETATFPFTIYKYRRIT
ncbi:MULTISPECIES: dihydrofolate reductase [unclassified Streptococcus]|uniref:dihydrofolate reductase n=1 Tax=unclassified Streptococcus TaxID=2608887 RepID=UPI0018AB9A3D|nr:dihydrofolate reductase [Streptococcus sp. NLN76]MBG9366602.1 dihydrofolate reductase [Streptococcus sp. NLN64]